MSQKSPSSFRLRPRFGLLAATAAVLGAALIGLAFAGYAPGSTAAVFICGAACMFLAGLYLVSPTWRLKVLVDDEGYALRSKRAVHFHVAWRDVKEVISSPDTKTCFVDSGVADTSLIVPGEGAHAPYDIENKQALFDHVLASVPPAVVREVSLLSRARAELEDVEPDA